jgi:hypothetical protein
MKIIPTLLLCATVLGCAASTPVARGDAGYFDAEIKVVAMKYLDDKDGRELFVIQDDGTVVAGGKPMCRVTGTQIETLDGALLLSVAPDGSVTGHRAPPEARFNAKNQLVTKHAILSVATNDIVGARRRTELRTDDESRFGEARMLLAWNNGNRVGVRGHFAVFDRRATRLALLLATILLMRPGTLDALPDAAATSP